MDFATTMMMLEIVDSIALSFIGLVMLLQLIHSLVKEKSRPRKKE